MSRFLNEAKYKDNVYSFPDRENASEQEKNSPRYNLEMSKATWNLYMKDKTAIGSSLYDYFNLFRRYSQGKQPSDIYKTYFSNQVKSGSDLVSDDVDGQGMKNREAQAKGWMNVDFENIFSFMPKTCRIIDGYFSDVDFDIRASNIDIDSGAEEEAEMYRYWGKSYFLNDINEIRTNAGLPLEEMDYIPETVDELKLIKDEGGFKQPYVMDLEKLLKHTENISNWGDILKYKLLADLRDCNVCFAHRFYNDETCKEEWGYLDPSDVVMQYSKHDDFRESEFKGFRRRTTISELRRKGFKESELTECQENLYGIYDNPSEAEWNKYATRSNTSSSSSKDIGDFRVDVFWLYWIDIINENKIKYITKSNEARYINYNEEISKRKSNEKQKYIKKYGDEKGYLEQPDENYISKKEEIIGRSVRIVRHCKWVIGTDLVYDYGIMPNQIRPEYNKPEIPIVGYKLSGRSMTDILTKPSDFYNMAALRFENTLSKAVEAGFAVDKSVMTAGADGKKFNPIKALQMHRETGYFLYSGAGSGLNRGGSPVPISALPGTLNEGLTTSLGIMEGCMKFVEDLTGFSPVTLGATPPKESQVGTTEMSRRSTMAALSPYENALKSMKQQLANSSAEAWQIALKNKQNKQTAKEASKIIGEEGVERIRAARKLHVQYGIKMIARPKNFEIDGMLKSIDMAHQAKKSGQGIEGINDAQRLQLRTELMNGGSVLGIIFKMDDWIRRDKKEIKAEKKELIDHQNQGLERLKQTEGKNAQDLEKLKLKNEVIKANIEAEKEKAIENRKTKNQLIVSLTEIDENFRNKVKEIIIQQGIGLNETTKNTTKKPQ